MWKKIAAVFCLVLAVILAGLVAMQRQQTANKAQELAALNTTIQQLETEKNKLEQELSTLTGTEDTGAPEETSGIICFTSVDESLFTQAYPKLQASGSTGVFIMEDGQLPGDYNTITVEECLELLNAGWSYGISLEDDFASEESWQASAQEYIDKICTRVGVFPSVYCFPEGTYNANAVMFLAENGISTILHHEQQPAKAADGVVQIPLYGYLEDLSDLDSDVFPGLELQIVWDEDTDAGLRYSAEGLSDVLEYGIVSLCDLSALQIMVQEPADQKGQVQSNAAEIDTLQEQISAIEEEIKQLYH